MFVVQGTSLGKAGVAPVLLRLLNPLTVPLDHKVGEYCCLTKLTLSQHGFPLELHISHVWLHDNVWNNHMVPCSCRVSKHGTRISINRNHH